jgi:hypothetical protein
MNFKIKNKNANNKSRGQISVEFLLILIIVLSFMATTAIPLASFAQKNALESFQLARSVDSAQRVVDAIERINSFGVGSKEMISVNLSEDIDAQLSCVSSGSGSTNSLVVTSIITGNFESGICVLDALGTSTDSVRTSTCTKPFGIGSADCYFGEDNIVVSNSQIIVKKSSSNQVNVCESGVTTACD